MYGGTKWTAIPIYFAAKSINNGDNVLYDDIKTITNGL